MIQYYYVSSHTFTLLLLCLCYSTWPWCKTTKPISLYALGMNRTVEQAWHVTMAGPSKPLAIMINYPDPFTAHSFLDLHFRPSPPFQTSNTSSIFSLHSRYRFPLKPESGRCWKRTAASSPNHHPPVSLVLSLPIEFAHITGNIHALWKAEVPVHLVTSLYTHSASSHHSCDAKSGELTFLSC